MKVNFVSALILAVCFLSSCSTAKLVSNNSFNRSDEKILIRTDFKKYFENCQVKGSTVVYDNKNRTWILSNTIDVRTENLPASTFKIINLLIALETNTIKNENEIIKWPGKTDTVKCGYRPDIYHDMTVKEAFKIYLNVPEITFM